MKKINILYRDILDVYFCPYRPLERTLSEGYCQHMGTKLGDFCQQRKRFVGSLFNQQITNYYYTGMGGETCNTLDNCDGWTNSQSYAHYMLGGKKTYLSSAPNSCQGKSSAYTLGCLNKEESECDKSNCDWRESCPRGKTFCNNGYQSFLCNQPMNMLCIATVDVDEQFLRQTADTKVPTMKPVVYNDGKKEVAVLTHAFKKIFNKNEWHQYSEDEMKPFATESYNIDRDLRCRDLNNGNWPRPEFFIAKEFQNNFIEKYVNSNNKPLDVYQYDYINKKYNYISDSLKKLCESGKQTVSTEILKSTNSLTIQGLIEDRYSWFGMNEKCEFQPLQNGFTASTKNCNNWNRMEINQMSLLDPRRYTDAMNFDLSKKGSLPCSEVDSDNDAKLYVMCIQRARI